MKQLVFMCDGVFDRVVGPFDDYDSAKVHIEALGYEFGYEYGNSYKYWYRDNREVQMVDYVKADDDYEQWKETINVHNAGSFSYEIEVEQWDAKDATLRVSSATQTIGLDLTSEARDALVTALQRARLR